MVPGVHMFFCRVLTMLSLFPVFSVIAGSQTHRVNVDVTVIAPPSCVINNDRVIDVNFGDVLTDKVDGVNYKVEVDYTINCSRLSNNALTLEISGGGASFNNEVLKTDVDNLGVRVVLGGANYIINEKKRFTYPNKPKLEVVPVKKAGVNLSGGKFTSVATLSVAYQ